LWRFYLQETASSAMESRPTDAKTISWLQALHNNGGNSTASILLLLTHICGAAAGSAQRTDTRSTMTTNAANSPCKTAAVRHWLARRALSIGQVSTAESAQLIFLLPALSVKQLVS
jgi:hypothetical protein